MGHRRGFSQSIEPNQGALLSGIDEEGALSDPEMGERRMRLQLGSAWIFRFPVPFNRHQMVDARAHLCRHLRSKTPRPAENDPKRSVLGAR